ncbi:MAG: GldG family protein [Alphaproteobacteria bacterium]|nr:GldG family protein [Alphaproteobacteria bacterium]
MISRRTYALSALALAAILFVGLNIFANNFFTGARLDLTQNGQFTLSKGTRNILDKLQEPVTLKFYYSRSAGARYAATAAYAKRVRDLLGEYAALSHGKLILQDIDPEPFTPEEDEASAAGLTPAPTDRGDVVYFGLSGSNSIDGHQTIPYFASAREAYLEYDLSSLVYHLSAPKKPSIALITGLPVMGSPQNPQPLASYAALAQEYDVTQLPGDFSAIPAGIDLLIVAHPDPLSPPQMLAIDNYVLSGHRALIFVDPLSELAQQAGPQATIASDLGPLLKSWGVDFPNNMVLLDRGVAQQVAAGNDPRQPTIAYPVWLHLTADSFDPRDPVTASLQNLNMASTGEIAPIRNATTVFHTLIGSSDQANMMQREQLMALHDPSRLVDTMRPTGVRYALAARITGNAKTAYPNAPGAVKSGKVQLMIVADSDVWDDRFWVNVSNQMGHPVAQPFADNGAFILNAVENLTGSDDLISLRTRASSDRPFTVVQSLRQAAETKYRETENTLQNNLTQAQQTLAQLQQGSGGNAIALSQKQKDEIERIRRGMAQTRVQLRDVQHNLRAEVDALGSRLAFLNIVGVPILLAGFALVLGMIRARRRRRTA